MAGFGNFGGDASSSQTLSNIINFTPNFQIGDGNRSDLANSLDQRSSAEAINRNATALSAGVSGSGTATGGSASLSDVSQRSSLTDGKGLTPAVLGNATAPDYAKYALILAGGVGLVYVVKQLKK